MGGPGAEACVALSIFARPPPLPPLTETELSEAFRQACEDGSAQTFAGTLRDRGLQAACVAKLQGGDSSTGAVDEAKVKAALLKNGFGVWFADATTAWTESGTVAGADAAGRPAA